MKKKDSKEKYIPSSSKDKLLSIEHFKGVLDLVMDQVQLGKGRQRHGMDSKFSEQPWKYITDGVGTGFPIGQSIKKLIELKNFHEQENPTPEQMYKWREEALGAIVYVVMTILWYEHKYISSND